MYDLINFNGSLVKDTHLERIAFNRGFLYGDGCFETMRIANRDIPLWDYHWRRLSQTADFLEFPSHPMMDSAKLKDEILSSLESFKHASAKIILFRTGLGKYAPKMPRLQYMITGKEVKTSMPIWQEDGIRVGYSEKSCIPASAPYGFIKKISALPYIIADQEKELRDLDELIILNTSGHVAEAINHNVFIIEKNKIFTTPLSSGCVGGVFRSFLIDYLREMGMEFEEKELTQADIEHADEIFLTNAYRFITPVGFVGDKKYRIKTSLSLFESINKNIKTLKK